MEKITLVISIARRKAASLWEKVRKNALHLFASINNHIRGSRLLQSMLGGFFICALVGGSLGWWFLYGKEDALLVVAPHTKVTTLTHETYSQSANIAVSVPKAFIVKKTEGKINARIIPFARGQWQESAEGTIVFDPARKLKEDRFYTVLVETDRGLIGDDFSVEADPSVVSVLPSGDGEVDERSRITINFSRPMVPLTTRKKVEQKELPNIIVTPETLGYFQWRGTRTLQFIPEKGLAPSTDYSIAIDGGLRAVDGVALDAYQTKFVTRNLRLKTVHRGSLSVAAPITAIFNQGVDLDSFASEIRITEGEKKKVEVIVEYGRDESDVEDKSIVNIYNAVDQYGRQKRWNAGEVYGLFIDKLAPAVGTYGLSQTVESVVNVTPTIRAVAATSERLYDADQFFFDPEGTLDVTFAEEIDLANSTFAHEAIREINYGNKCRFENLDNVYNYEETCERVEDQTKIQISWEDQKIGRAQDIAVSVEKLVAADGKELSAQGLEITAKSYPALTVKKGSEGTSATGVTLCSTMPLFFQKRSENFLTADKEFRFDSVYADSSRIVSGSSTRGCAVGEYASSVSYKLLPKQAYAFKGGVRDVTDQEAVFDMELTSGEISRYDKSIISHHNSYGLNVTTQDRTKLSYSLLNLDYVDVEICKMDVEEFLGKVHRNRHEGSPQCIEKKEKKIEVAKGLYWDPASFSLDLRDEFDDVKGHYEITMTHPEYTQYSGGKREVRTYISVTNIGAVKKSTNLGREVREEDRQKMQDLYWVFNMQTLESEEDAKITLYKGKRDQKPEASTELTTDREGIATVRPEADVSGGIITIGDDTALVGIAEGSLGGYRQAETVHKTYLYSDRPIYRPGQDVHIKGLVRVGFDGDYEYKEKSQILLRIVDSTEKVIHKQDVEISPYGTVHATFQLPIESPLGDYKIETVGNYIGQATFDVEEYVPSPFKVGIEGEKEEYTAGEELALTIDGEYFFGAPVAGAEVSYSIGTQEYNFDRFGDERFSFGRGWYDCYYNCNFGDTFITSSKATLGADGKARISHAIDFEKWFKQDSRHKSAIATVYATVKSANGQSVSSQKSFIIHRGEYYLGLRTREYFVPKNALATIEAKTVDVAGKEISQSNLTLSVYKQQWINNKRQEVDGGYYVNAKKELVLKDTLEVNTNSGGNWSGQYAFPEAGSYELVLAGSDSKGNDIKKTAYMYVSGAEDGFVRRTNDNTLSVSAEKTALGAGDTAKLLFESPYERARALVTVERGQVYEHKIIDVNESFTEYSFPIKDDYVPNVYGAVTLISPYPEVKHGTVQFHIDRSKKEIDLSVKSNKKQYLPGEEVTLDITATDSAGAPVAAEVSVAVADLSVLALKGNPQKNPLIFFYDGFPLTISTSSTVANILFEKDVASDTKGGGGADPEDLAKRKRGDFRDTAYWRHDVVTDANGRATVSFVLPDNLTTWQVESIGITRDTKLGKDYKEFTATKDVLVTPIAPRFVIAGDQFEMGAHVFNRTDAQQTFTVKTQSETLQIKTEPQIITLPPDGSEVVYFQSEAPGDMERGSHNYTITVINDRYEDVLEKTIPLTENITYETTALSGRLTSGGGAEYIFVDESIVPDRGGVEIGHSATLAVFLDNALEYLVKYPYGCSEQIATKLKGMSYVAKALEINSASSIAQKVIEYDGRTYTIDEALADGLNDLLVKQRASGGFVYFDHPSATENFFLTLYVAKTLHALKEAGAPVPEKSIERAYEYIARTVESEANRRKDDANGIYIMSAAALAEGEALGDYSNLIKQVKKIAKNKKYLNDEASSLTLAHLAGLVGTQEKIFGRSLENRVFAALENRIIVDARGASVAMNKGNIYRQYYESPINDTALALKAYAKAERDFPHVDGMIRWLLANRNSENVWETTNATGNVIDAFNAYLGWKGEHESAFDIAISLGENEVSAFSYKASNIFTQNTAEIEMTEISKDTLNEISFVKQNKNQKANTLYYDVALRYGYPLEDIEALDEGFSVTQSFYGADDTERENPLTSAKVGETLTGLVEVVVPSQRSLVSVESYIPAGTALVNANLATEYVEGQEKDQEITPWGIAERDVNGAKVLRPIQEELRDDRVFLFVESLAPGTYTYEYTLRATVPGTYQLLPTAATEMYFPEVFGRTAGKYFTVEK